MQLPDLFHRLIDRIKSRSEKDSDYDIKKWLTADLLKQNNNLWSTEDNSQWNFLTIFDTLLVQDVTQTVIRKTGLENAVFDGMEIKFEANKEQILFEFWFKKENELIPIDGYLAQLIANGEISSGFFDVQKVEKFCQFYIDLIKNAELAEQLNTAREGKERAEIALTRVKTKRIEAETRRINLELLPLIGALFRLKPEHTQSLFAIVLLLAIVVGSYDAYYGSTQLGRIRQMLVGQSESTSTVVSATPDYLLTTPEQDEVVVTATSVVPTTDQNLGSPVTTQVTSTSETQPNNLINALPTQGPMAANPNWYSGNKPTPTLTPAPTLTPTPTETPQPKLSYEEQELIEGVFWTQLSNNLEARFNRANHSQYINTTTGEAIFSGVYYRDTDVSRYVMEGPNSEFSRGYFYYIEPDTLTGSYSYQPLSVAYLNFYEKLDKESLQPSDISEQLVYDLAQIYFDTKFLIRPIMDSSTEQTSLPNFAYLSKEKIFDAFVEGLNPNFVVNSLQSLNPTKSNLNLWLTDYFNRYNIIFNQEFYKLFEGTLDSVLLSTGHQINQNGFVERPYLVNEYGTKLNFEAWRVRRLPMIGHGNLPHTNYYFYPADTLFNYYPELSPVIDADIQGKYEGSFENDQNMLLAEIAMFLHFPNQYATSIDRMFSRQILNTPYHIPGNQTNIFVFNDLTAQKLGLPQEPFTNIQVPAKFLDQRLDHDTEVDENELSQLIFDYGKLSGINLDNKKQVAEVFQLYLSTDPNNRESVINLGQQLFSMFRNFNPKTESDMETVIDWLTKAVKVAHMSQPESLYQYDQLRLLQMLSLAGRY